MIGNLATAAALALLLASAAPAAEEARDADGRRTPGALALDAAGRLRFTPAGQDKPTPADQIDVIHFAPAAPAPFRVVLGRRVLLYEGQQITGRLLGVDKDNVRLRTAWTDHVDVSRAAAAALVPPPGWRAVFDDDFADGLKAWTVAGKPALNGGGKGDEPTAVTLAEPGQALTYAPAAPPDAGRVGVNFRDADAAGARWRCVLRFGAGKDERTLAVTVAGGDAYEVEAPVDGEARRVARSAGWHRLTVQFSEDTLRVLCDDAVLWYSLEHGPGGPLRQVALACEEAKPGPARGSVAWAEFSLARAADEPPLPPGDAEQDEALTADGDQIFGDVLRADGRAVEVQGTFGKRSLPWADLRGVRFRRGAAPAHTTTGAHVRLWVDSGLDAEPDVLDGVVAALDDKALTLQHALLGEVRVGRDRVRRLRPLFFGRRVELDNGAHHLGDGKRAVAGLSPPRAEGPALKLSVRLDAAPAEARLTLFAVRPAGAADAGPPTEVVVNGRRVDYLNRLAGRASPEPRRLVVPLPRDALRAGDNVIELRQTADPATERLADCGVFGVALELPE
jgi:hypothetical protein